MDEQKFRDFLSQYVVSIDRKAGQILVAVDNSGKPLKTLVGVLSSRWDDAIEIFKKEESKNGYSADL